MAMHGGQRSELYASRWRNVSIGESDWGTAKRRRINGTAGDEWLESAVPRP